VKVEAGQRSEDLDNDLEKDKSEFFINGLESGIEFFCNPS
jgi:hypothetical protein